MSPAYIQHVANIILKHAAPQLERLARLEEFAKELASQKLPSDMEVNENIEADFEDAFETAITKARALSASTNNGRASEGSTT